MKTKNNIFDNSKTLTSILILVYNFIYLFINWSTIPQSIPTHYDLQGVVDNYGGKQSLLLIPIISLIIFCVISFLQKFPEISNTPIKLTVENKHQIYAVQNSMIITLKLITISIFFYISIMQTTLKQISSAFLPITIFLLLITFVYYLYKMNKAK